MRIDLADVRRRPSRWSETLELDPATLDHPEIVALSPVETSGEVHHVEPHFAVGGSLRYEQTLSCYRCLGETTETIQDRFDYLVHPTEEAAEGEDGERHGAGADADGVELGEEDLEILFLDSEELDLTDLIREQVLLHVPMKPVCSAACRGLCDHCGADLNDGPCSCDRTEVDPRWAGLEALRQRMTDGGSGDGT